MQTDALNRAIAFRSSFARRQAAELVDVTGGFIVADRAYAGSWEHNQLFLDSPVDPDTVAAEYTRHQQISVLDDDLAQACAPLLGKAGYGHDVEVMMVHTGPAPTPSGLARAVGLDALLPAVERQLRVWMPDAGEETVRHLVDRRRARQRGAERVEFIASSSSGGSPEGGEPASWCDLYLEPDQGIAQIEELVTAEAHTRRGHADAVLTEALHRAAEAGCGLRFLVADAGDWPQHWYARRGFTPVGRSHRFYRTNG